MRRKPLARVTEGMRALHRELGVADTIRFLNQFRSGSENHTAERDLLLAGQSLDNVLSSIDEARRLAELLDERNEKRAAGE